ncbi:MAG: NUDIX domain-containing protein [Alphaproteobacteria bacterium]|nr:MAG: NUDIX domain-containing protein [Alphaproteobacteria bacterium]
MSPGAQPVRPLPAASILLLRDGRRGLEVLTVRRGRHLAFGGGMLAFPGGRVDGSDRSWRGAGDAFGSRRHADQAFRVAALRELFEEAGLLLARDAGRAGALPERAVLRRAAHCRRPLHQRELSFRACLRRLGLRLDTQALVPFSHWVTPAIAPKRFDTRFYLARAPRGQEASADAVESFDLAWRTPVDILDAWRRGADALMFPTRLNLMKLAESPCVRTALVRARRSPLPRIEPRLAGDGTPRLLIPASAGYGVTEAGPGDLHRIEAEALLAFAAARAAG